MIRLNNNLINQDIAGVTEDSEKNVENYFQ